MNRILASLSIGMLLAAPAAAQCLTGLGAAVSTGVAGDDTIGATHYALGLTYANPIGGALPGGYTHVRVCSNGWLMLTDGTLSTGLPGTGSYGSTSNTTAGLGGGAGSFPLIAPYWGDANIVGAGNAVYVLASSGPGVPAEITWSNTSDYAYTTVQKTVKVLIYDDPAGTIKFQYGTPFAVQGGAARYIGVSTRNGIATVPPQTPLGVAGASSGSSGMCFKTFPTGAVNLVDHEITFSQNGLGGWAVANTCGTPIYPPPLSASVGTGCYSIPGVAHESFFESFATTAATKAALEGHSMTLTPIVSPAGYLATWNVGGAAAYVAPGTAPASTGVVTLPTTDDGTTVVTSPSLTPLSTPFGPSASVGVSHNGVVFMDPLGTAGFTPSAATMASQVYGGFFSWIDFYDVPTTSGKIKTEEGTVGADTVLYITWDGVNRYNVAGSNTIQFQLNLTTGQVDILWVTLDGVSSPFSPGAVIGYTDPGTSVLPAAIDLDGGGLPLTTFPDVPPVLPMALSVDTLPIITLPSGDTVPMTWTVTNVPEASHILAGLRACNIVFSIAPAVVGGLDLGLVLNTPPSLSGCVGYVATADAFVDVTTVNGTGICTSTPFVFSPPPSLIGLVLTTQAIAIAPAGTYAGFPNDIGGGNSLWTSNAIQQTYNPL
ncbi:MAG: hypothetical protein JNM25_13475 [Planctomycetes bacterium]|nr:hypothetical protein [Planctomycetota bacterium]